MLNHASKRGPAYDMTTIKQNTKTQEAPFTNLH